ncbi:MAG TPA: peptidyl-prolyl cis-trans isomerase, partial [Dongiaceae bacterium]|nr:peptidyl-prolyl cis-trans isomerase [Dongiaceae bacterium]
MLSAIRSKTTGWVAKILFVILIVAFGVWGIGDIFRGDQAQKPVAQVGDVKYSQGEFQRDLKQQLDKYQAQGVPLTAQQFAQFGGVAQIIAQAVNRSSLKVFAEQQNMGVSQQTAITEIQADPQFQNEQKQFDRNRFVAALDQIGLSEAAYVDEVRTDLVNRGLYRAMLTGIAVPQKLTDEVYLHDQEQRTADVLVIPTASMTGIATPDDATLQKFQKDHADNYKAPEYRAATVIEVAPEDLVGEVSVSDDEINQGYESTKAQYSTPDTREIEQVVVQDQATADKVEAAVKGGAAFKDAVKQVTGGDPIVLGKIGKEKLPAEIADKAFAVPAGGVSDPLTSPFGIHIIHVISAQLGGVKPLAEVKDQVKHQIALQKATENLDSLVQQLEDTLAGGASLDEAATKLKLKAKKVDAVDLEGKDPKGDDAGLSHAAVTLVFNTESGNMSPVAPTASGSYIVAQVSGVTPPADRPFADVKDKVTADWMADAQKKAAEDKAKAIADKVNKGGDLNAEATALGQTIKKSASFTRDRGDPANGILADFAQTLFTLKLNAAAVGDSKDGPVVAKVTAITPPDPKAHPADVDQTSQQLTSEIRNDLGAEFAEALRQE